MFSFLLRSPSQPVVVFFIFYSALCTLGQVGTYRECRPSQALKTVQNSTNRCKNPTHSSLQDQSIPAPAPKQCEWWRCQRGRRKASNSGHWVGVEEHSKEPRLQAPGACSIVPLNFTYKTQIQRKMIKKFKTVTNEH